MHTRNRAPVSLPDPKPAPDQPVQPAAPKPFAIPPVTVEVPPVVPKFHNKSKAEDQELIDQLMKMILEGKLTEITPSHVLASSPIIRTHLINYLRNQRVEVNHLTQTFEASSPNKRIVAADSLPLGEIEVLINQQIPVRGVIDNGSQIITIREDLWKELSHATILPAFRMMMEGADTNVSGTKGKIQDLPISVGPLTLYVQAQVVRMSPCKLLLGLPFWALTNCHLDIYADGFMTATLRDPNPPCETVVVQSFPRNPNLDRMPLESLLQEITIQKEDSEESHLVPKALRNIALASDPDVHSFFYSRQSLDTGQ
jgi:hypothetical protein